MLRKYDLNDLAFQKFTLYNDGKLAILDKIADLASQICHTPEVAVSSDFYTIILCLKGEVTFLYNGILKHLVSNTLLLSSPGVTLSHLHHSPDLKCHTICMTPSYANRLIPMSHNAWNIRRLINQQPLIPLQEQETHTIDKYCELLQQRVRHDGINHHHIIDSLMQTLMYELRDITTQTGLNVANPFTSAEYLFNKFIELLESSYPKNRKVEFYAQCLNVSSKHLSLVCKQVCHQTCSALINQYVARDIEQLLKFSPKNIKEITHEMGFPNPSFFTRFVKRHLGASPKTLRERWTRELNLTDTETAPDNQSK